MNILNFQFVYYNIRLDWDPKIIGVKNGIYQVELDEKAYNNETYNILKSLFISGAFTAKQEYPEVNFKFYFKMLKSAQKTDFMSFTPNINHGLFLVNEKVTSVFKHFKTQQHKYFKTVIYDAPAENLDDSYSIFYSVLQDWNVIDFDKTVFTFGGFGNNPIIEHSFTNENEMRKFNGIAKVKTLSLSEKFDNSLDFFLTPIGGLFVSEDLKLELERNSISGIKFTKEVRVLTHKEVCN